MVYNNLAELFKATADAIRSKTGGTEPIVANDFPTAIKGISGGGSSGGSPDTGVVAVAWHNDRTYDQPMGEGMFKVSDIAPSMEQLNNAVAVLGVDEFGCAAYDLDVQDIDGMIAMLYPVTDTEMRAAGVIVPDGMGMPPEMVGFYITPTHEGMTDCYIVWEP